MKALFRLGTLAPLAAALAIAACGGDSNSPSPTPTPSPSPTPPPAGLQLTTQTVIASTAGLQQPIDMQPAPGDTRLFIAERPGRLRIVESGTVRTTPFLDIVGRVGSTTGERGLLSFAFHPQYASGQAFVYVHYTEGATGDIIVDRYQPLAGDANRLDVTSRIEVIRIAHRQASNHNGGRVAFGPDGMLYLSTGDGGGANDQFGNGQNRNTLLGKLLRLNVNGTQTYTIPADNPTWGGGTARQENWAIGLRNPWRYAFDGNRLYIADVGQNAIEEINAVSAASGGLNYGWSIQEGTSCFNASTCDSTGLTQPVAQYPNPAQGCSITGGYVYRGSAIPELQGRYFYSDFCAGFVRSLLLANGTATEPREWIPQVAANQVLSFGVDPAGELYLLLSSGRVEKIVRQ